MYSPPTRFRCCLRCEFRWYRHAVQRVTAVQPLTQLEGYGRDGYELDHIVSVKIGFVCGLDPSVIGAIPNLAYIPQAVNAAKGSRLTEAGKALLWQWGIDPSSLRERSVKRQQYAMIMTEKAHGWLLQALTAVVNTTKRNADIIEHIRNHIGEPETTRVVRSNDEVCEVPEVIAASLVQPTLSAARITSFHKEQCQCAWCVMKRGQSHWES